MVTVENTVNSVGGGKRETLNIIWFSLGKLTSIFGSSIYTFALGLYVLKLTGSGLSFATTLVLGLLPAIVVNPLAGVAADRFDRKSLVVGMDLLSGALLLGLFFYTSSHSLSLLAIYISTFALTVFTTMFNISFEVALPGIVTQGKLMSINSISRIIDSAASILGPMIGGMVYATMDIRFFIIVNGVTFIVSAFIEMLIDFKLNSKERKSPGKIYFKGLVEDLKDAVEYTLERRWILNLFAIFIFLNFFISLSISVPLPFIINEVLMLESSYFGLIQGAFPIGTIVGALIIGKLDKFIDYFKNLTKMSAITSLCMLLIGFPLMFSNLCVDFYLIYYSVIMMILGIAISFIDIPILYILQMEINDSYRGRVLSLGTSMAKIISPVALLVSGYLMNKVPPYVLPMTGGSLLLLSNLLLTPELIENR